MTTYTITITDSFKLAGISASTEKYNATIPVITQAQLDAGEIQQPPLTEADYLQYVIDNASDGWSKANLDEKAISYWRGLTDAQKVAEAQAKGML